MTANVSGRPLHECVEVTPDAVRIREVVLDQNERAKIAARARKENAS